MVNSIIPRPVRSIAPYRPVQRQHIRRYESGKATVVNKGNLPTVTRKRYVANVKKQNPIMPTRTTIPLRAKTPPARLEQPNPFNSGIGHIGKSNLGYLWREIICNECKGRKAYEFTVVEFYKWIGRNYQRERPELSFTFLHKEKMDKYIDKLHEYFGAMALDYGHVPSLVEHSDFLKPSHVARFIDAGTIPVKDSGGVYFMYSVKGTFGNVGYEVVITRFENETGKINRVDDMTKVFKTREKAMKYVEFITKTSDLFEGMYKLGKSPKEWPLSEEQIRRLRKNI